MYIPRNWEFGSALLKIRNLGEGGFEPPKPPPSVRHCLVTGTDFALVLRVSLHDDNNDGDDNDG
jgi:hypothetical protein